MGKCLVSIMLVLSLLAVSGCGDGGAAVLKRRSNLDQLAAAYTGFVETHGKTPANATELSEFMRSGLPDIPPIQDAIVSLEEGDVVMIWNGDLGDTGSTSAYVLGFEAGVPATGGYVVMGDGVVRLMTAKDYSEATMLPTADR